ncbi:MAG: hypothetical protein FJX74_22730 [Armatimonadetes bacterium]|nr:hypothetical protein [Armatimonadota bacterium]
MYGPPPPSPLWGAQPGGVGLAAMPPVARVSKGLLLGLVYGGFIGALVIAVVGGVLQAIGDQNGDQSLVIAGVVVIVVGVLVLLGGMAAWLFLLHRAWSAIQDGHARTTPGKAVGFMFIPLFNIWWLFQAYQGFAQDFNSFRDRHRLPLEPLNESHFTAYCACWLLGNLPYVGIVANLGALIMMGVIGSAMADRINGIADVQASQSGYGPPPPPI